MKRVLSILLALVIIVAAVPLGAFELKAEALNQESSYESKVWNGDIDTDWEGEGTSSNPYLISTAEELAGLANKVNSGTTYSGVRFCLTRNIVLNNVDDYENWSSAPPKNEWIPIGNTYWRYFSGVFDGCGYTISGVYIDKTESTTGYTGLFGCLRYANVKNLGLKESYLCVIGNRSVEYCIGGISARATCTNFENCYNGAYVKFTASGSLTNVSHMAGGIIGLHEGGGTIKNCYNIGYIYCSSPGSVPSAGGIIGDISTDPITPTVVKNCYNAGSVIGRGPSGYAGGILGLWHGKYNCYSLSGSFSGSRQTIYHAGEILTSEQMRSSDSYNGWDFNETWYFDENINNGYPILRVFLDKDVDFTKKKVVDGFNFYMNYPSNYLNKGDTVNLHVGYYLNGEVDTTVKEYIYTISNSSVIKTDSTRWDNTCGQSMRITAVAEGSSVITVTHPITRESAALEIYVTSREFGYNFYNIPKMSIELGKTTNFYNFNGLVVDNFAYIEHKDDSGITDYYTVTMEVYNTHNLYGAVTAYDKNGEVYSYKILDKLDTHDSSFVSSCKSLYYNIGDLYYLIQNNRYYSGESISKKTEVSVNVPIGGHISISNNSNYSEIVCAANIIGLLFDSAMLTYNFATMKVDSDIFIDKNAVIKDLIEDLSENQTLDLLKESMWKEFSQYDKIDIFTFSKINQLNDSLAKKMNFDINSAIEKTIDNALSATESIVKNVLPTGQIIDILYSFSEGCNIATFLDKFLESFNIPLAINIYAPVNPNDYYSNGIEIDSANDYSETIIHAYTVMDSDNAGIRDTTFEKKNIFYSHKYQTYNITMYKNGVETQPESTVTVKIPIPDNFNIGMLKVYRNNEDGSLTDMNAHISGSYIVFETNHFSYYSIVDESNPNFSEDFKFTGASITLQDDLLINYKVDKSLFEKLGYENPYIIFQFDGKEIVKQNYRVENEQFVFTFSNIAPHKISENITATLYATYNGIEFASEARDYSIAQYCYNMLDKCTDDKYAEFRTLLVDLLNYGAQSQIYTNYNTQNLANASLTDTQKAWGTQGIPTLNTVQKLDYETVENPTVKWYGGGLVLDDSVTMRFIIQTDNIENLSVKMTAGDKTYTARASSFKSIGNNLYYVYFNSLNASQMSETVYLTVYNGEEAVSNTLRYSIESYAYAKVGGEDAALSDLLIAMMKYGNAAYDYVK